MPRILGGRLKRNEQCVEDVSSETSNSARMSQAIREACRECIKRNKHILENVSSDPRSLSGMSQAKQA
eukprot:1862912-Pyramimonas_sp.AAC.1